MKINYSSGIPRAFVFLIVVVALSFQSCQRPKEDIVLRRVKDVVADASSEPTLKAEAVFFNPNDASGRLRNINVDIFVNGKKVGRVEKDYKIKIPANSEFSVPLEVKLNMKELGLVDTILGMIGGKKFDVKYVGKLGLTYKGIPIRVPVDYTSQIRVSF
jgi:LEA14-like dessication related protein